MDFIRDYMLKNNLNFKDDNIKSKYLCGICDKVVSKPKSAKCGCCFCSDCLSQYTENKCPSCKSVVNLENEVSYDFRAELKIGQLCITCPNVMCTERHKINDMESHLGTCTNKGVKCIFSQFGCDNLLQSSGMMHEHVTSQLTEHLAMLLSNIEVRTNEKSQVIQRINEKIEEIIVDNVSIKNDINNINDKIKENSDHSNQEIEDIKEEIKKNEENAKLDMINMKREIIELINEKEKKREIKKNKILEVGENYVATENSCKVTFKDMNKKARDNAYYSDVFNINFYNFKIRIYYFSNHLISFSTRLVKGAEDDKLEWPLKHKLSLTLLKPDGSVYICNKFSYDTISDKYKTDYNRSQKSESIIQESQVAVLDYYMMNNDSVSVVLSMY